MEEQQVLEPKTPENLQKTEIPQKPDSYLPWAILTAFGCLPCGIIAIIYSAKVDSSWNAGRYDDAFDAALTARKWTWIGAGLCIGIVLLYINPMLYLIAVVGGAIVAVCVLL